MSKFITCTPKSLPSDLWIAAAERAIQINPVNQPPPRHIPRAAGGAPPDPRALALEVGKRWPTTGVRLTVSFLDNPPADLRAHILSHMNAWAKSANVEFTESDVDPQVRIARVDWPPENAGYWSYVGTDILSIPMDEPTMNLEGFTMESPESEFCRVVRHETGHTLGFPHEHMRKELVDRIDEVKAVAHFGQTQGWDPDEVYRQVLTPLEDVSILGTPLADETSIMCYQIPGWLTKDGLPIIGGVDINELDYAFAASIYPKSVI